MQSVDPAWGKWGKASRIDKLPQIFQPVVLPRIDRVRSGRRSQPAHPGQGRHEHLGRIPDKPEENDP
jgi:hypothetical protein